MLPLSSTASTAPHLVDPATTEDMSVVTAAAASPSLPLAQMERLLTLAGR